MMARFLTHRPFGGCALCLTVMLLLIGCNSSKIAPVSGLDQGVRGIVWLIPDYDHSDMMLVLNPPDLTPRPLPEAQVYLMLTGETFTNSDIISTTVTDSLGRYELEAPPGTYRLAVVAKNVQTVGRYIPSADTSEPGFFENALVVIEIRDGRFTEQTFEIGELVPQ